MGTLIMFGILGLTVVMIYVVVGYLDPQARRSDKSSSRSRSH